MLTIMISIINAHRHDIPPSRPGIDDGGDAMLKVLIKMFDEEENEFKERKPSASRDNSLAKIARYRKCLVCNMKND